jgi:hypothetical protein
MGLEVASELINAYARENAANERESDAAGNTVARQGMYVRLHCKNDLK